MKRSPRRMDKILEAQIQALTTTRRPKTVKCYRYCAHNFLAFLHTAFPRLRQLSQLRRDPHLLAWFRFLCQQYPSPGNRTRHLHLLTARRLLRDLANQGHPVTPDLIGREDFPPSDHYLPKPLSLEQDQRLQQQLRLVDTLEVNALRLMRATGIRISECIHLPLDCLQQICEQQVALRVPLGKLHSERFVPVDEETQRVVARIVELGGGGELSLLCRAPQLSYCLAIGNLRLGTGCCTIPYAMWLELRAAPVGSTRTAYGTPSPPRWYASASVCRR